MQMRFAARLPKLVTPPPKVGKGYVNYIHIVCLFGKI